MTKRINIPLISTTLAIGLSGCAIQFQQLNTSDPVEETDAVVVLGVSPNSRLSFFEGEFQGGSWKCTSWYNIANVWSDEGYIVLKLKPRTDGKNYAIGQILPTGIGGNAYVLQKGAVVPVFHAQPGKVTFVGAIKLIETNVGNGYAIVKDTSVTKSDAETFIYHRYPNLSADLAAEPLQLMAAAGGC